MPPPVQIGERLEPARARPGAVWRPGLAPPPAARPRGGRRGPLKGGPKAAASSLTFVVAPRSGASAIGAYLHDRASRAGHRAADEQQVLLGVDAADLQALLRGC